MWDPTGSGIKPMSLALAGGFLTAEQGNPDSPVLYDKFWEAAPPVPTGPLFLGTLAGEAWRPRIQLPPPCSWSRGYN